jgi:hypothetical protein
VQLSDESTLKLVLREEKIELQTAYGRLSIPAADIVRIDFSLRVPEDVQRQIAAASADLAHASFARREAALKNLLAMREKAYPALRQATRSKDLEVARRAEKALEELSETLPDDALKYPATDIVYTADSKIAGQIKLDAFRVKTLSFGEQSLKLADIRTLKTPGATETQTAQANEIMPQGVLPDPGTLAGFAGQAGQKLTFQVNALPAALGMRGGVFGTDVYTTDSSLALAAVHAGVLRPGQAGVVRVTLVGMHPGFQPSVRNGIASQPWGAYTGFRIEAPKRGAAKENK